jgi:hypothetical protein|nr:MAG TPA: hypothetical protein [Caudoviricetes sp.]
MLCDTCIYKDCEGMSCSECKFLRRSETIYGNIIDVCYCDYKNHCQGKQYDGCKLMTCIKYESKQNLFKQEETND